MNVLPPTLFRASRTTTLTPDSDSNLAADKPTRQRESALKQVAAISHINDQKLNQSFNVRDFNPVFKNSWEKSETFHGILPQKSCGCGLVACYNHLHKQHSQIEVSSFRLAFWHFKNSKISIIKGHASYSSFVQCIERQNPACGACRTKLIEIIIYEIGMLQQDRLPTSSLTHQLYNLLLSDVLIHMQKVCSTVKINFKQWSLTKAIKQAVCRYFIKGIMVSAKII